MKNKTPQNNRVQYNIVTWIMVVMVLILTAMTYSIVSSTKMIRQHAQLIDIAMEIKLETALSHLWLEKVDNNTKTEDRSKASEHLHKAMAHANMLIQGGTSPTGTLTPLNDDELAIETRKIIQKITEFEVIARQRLEDMSISGGSTVSKQHLDIIFLDLFAQSNKVEHVLKEVVARNLYSFKITLILLLTLSFVLATLTCVTMIRSDKRRREQHKLLQKSENNFKTFFNSINDAVFIHPAKTDGLALFTEVNPVACTRYGYSREELLQLSVPDITKETAIEKLYGPNALSKLHKDKQLVFESIHITKSGEEIPVEINANIIEQEGEEPLILSVARDITQRKQAEEDLATEKERLSVTLRSIGDGVITTDINGRVVFLNKVAEELCGWSSEEASGKLSTEVFNIINEKTGVKCVSPVQRVIDLGRIIGLANHTALIAKDGSIRSIADSGAPIRDMDSKIIGVVIVFRDVTHEQKMTEELLKIRKLESVGVLAGGIAHDFNNILAAILGNIELAGYRISKEDLETAALLRNAKQATKRATKLTGQLLTFSKGGDPIKEETALKNLITESADFVIHGSKVVCEYVLPDNLWTVDVDSGQISQVIQNIVINAKHALPEGGTVVIQCDNIEDPATEALLSVDKGNYIRITVHDTGVGIPREIISKIFDPYFTTKQSGSGLGLAICHSIINKHDGYLTADSSPGKGTQISIYLPATTSGNTVKKPNPEPQIQRASKAARIMLMDDEQMIRTLVQSQLSNLGHEAILAVDGEQAINKYQELQDSGNPVDLVIMDLTIPGGMGGQEAAKKLLAIDPAAKIIVASGYSNDPVMAHYKDYGFCGAVIKPFDLTELSNTINLALKEKKQD